MGCIIRFIRLKANLGISQLLKVYFWIKCQKQGQRTKKIEVMSIFSSKICFEGSKIMI